MQKHIDRILAEFNHGITDPQYLYLTIEDAISIADAKIVLDIQDEWEFVPVKDYDPFLLPEGVPLEVGFHINVNGTAVLLYLQTLSEESCWAHFKFRLASDETEAGDRIAAIVEQVFAEGPPQQPLLNARAAYTKVGFRNFNFHRWSFTVEDLTRHMYGITAFGFCLDVSRMNSKGNPQ